MPVSCNVFLTVTDPQTQAQSQCGGVVNTGACALDCFGNRVSPSSVIATFDRCGVCNGNGQSCINCTEADQSERLVALDGNARAQLAVVRKAAKLLTTSAKGNKSAQNFAQQQLTIANKLFEVQWTSFWAKLPVVSKTCEANSFCTTVSNADVLKSLSVNTTEFDNIVKRLIRKLRSVTKSKTIGASVLKSSTKELKTGISQINAYPSSNSVCG